MRKGEKTANWAGWLGWHWGARKTKLGQEVVARDVWTWDCEGAAAAADDNLFLFSTDV